jgi:hypothetical protein
VTSGTSDMIEASLGGRVSSVSIPLEETTHTCAEKDGFRNGGVP